jgi:hypothetical protein
MPTILFVGLMKDKSDLREIRLKTKGESDESG